MIPLILALVLAASGQVCDVPELLAASREWAKRSTSEGLGIVYGATSACERWPASANCYRSLSSDYAERAVRQGVHEKAESRWRRAVEACGGPK